NVWVFLRLRLAAAVVVADHTRQIPHLLQYAEFPVGNVVQEHAWRHDVVAEVAAGLVQHRLGYPDESVHGGIADDSAFVVGLFIDPEDVRFAGPVNTQADQEHQQGRDRAEQRLHPRRFVRQQATVTRGCRPIVAAILPAPEHHRKNPSPRTAILLLVMPPARVSPTAATCNVGSRRARSNHAPWAYRYAPVPRTEPLLHRAGWR